MTNSDPRARALGLAALVVVLALALDQGTKEWALRRLSDNRTIDVLPTVEFDLTYNSGFSFGTGAGSGRLIGALVIVVSVVVAWQIWKADDRVRQLLFAGILGGALGNLVDRVFRADAGFLSGEVIDFIDVSWYAVFNVADIFVVCSAIALVLHELRTRPRHPPTEPAR